MILSEGAGAVLLDRERRDRDRADRCRAAISGSRREARICVEQMFGRLGAANDDIIIASANGTFIDAAERTAIFAHCPDGRGLFAESRAGRKRRREHALAGDLRRAVASTPASCRRCRCRSRNRPCASASSRERTCESRRAIVSACGMNQQVAGAVVAPRRNSAARSSSRQRPAFTFAPTTPPVLSRPANAQAGNSDFCSLFWSGARAKRRRLPASAASPIEITSTGGTSYQNGIATARDNVAIRVGDTDIYADAARLRFNTKKIRLRGQRPHLSRRRALRRRQRAPTTPRRRRSNADKLRTARIRRSCSAANASRRSAKTPGSSRRAAFTTHDSSKPDFQLRATTVRIYENDRVIMQNVTFYVGRVPIFYWPYVYQSLDDAFSFVISPAYMSSWGRSLLGRLTFPITERHQGQRPARLPRATRRARSASRPEIRYGNEERQLREACAPTSSTTRTRPSTAPRCRAARSRTSATASRLEDRTKFTDDITGFVHGDEAERCLRAAGFFPGRVPLDPQPDNIVARQQISTRVTSLTAYTRFQLNNFYEATERLPEDRARHHAAAALRQPAFSTKARRASRNLRRNFPPTVIYQDYEALSPRYVPSVPLSEDLLRLALVRAARRVPRHLLQRDARHHRHASSRRAPNPLIPDFLLPPPNRRISRCVYGGERFRTVVNAGAEASFKVSRTWEQAQSRAFGLDGLRHIVQPFANFSYVAGNGTDPAEILQFDRYHPVDSPAADRLPAVHFDRLDR